MIEADKIFQPMDYNTRQYIGMCYKMIQNIVVEEYNSEATNAQFDIMSPWNTSELIISITADDDTFHIFSRPKWRITTGAPVRYDFRSKVWTFFKKWGTVIPAAMAGVFLVGLGAVVDRPGISSMGENLLNTAFNYNYK